MAVVVAANQRGGLPEPLRPCACARCFEPTLRHAEENRLATAHFHPKRPGILYKPVELDECGQVIPPKGKRNRRKCSILDLADELLVMIAAHLDNSVYKYCLALSCKRMLAIVSERDPKKKPELALQANNVTGPWKEQLMVTLARGWIPKHKLKLCFGCWRFMPYGSVSKRKYIALEKVRTCHLRRKDWIDNWEVKTWFRQVRPSKNDSTSFIADGRLRCPMCVLENHDLHVRDKRYRKKTTQGKGLKALEGLEGLEQSLKKLLLN